MNTQEPQGEHRKLALYSQRDIILRGSFSKSHLYNLIARGQFPKPCLVMGSRFTRWSSDSVDQFFADPVKWLAVHKNSEVTV